jgi:hypothetical protein
MFRNMCEQADHGCRQSSASDPARLGQRRRIDATDHVLRAGERSVQVGQQFAETRARLHLCSERGHLRFIQFAPLEVSGQAIHAAGNVAYMKSQRCKSVRTGPDLCGGQPLGVRDQIFASLLKRVKRRRKQRIDVR